MADNRNGSFKIFCKFLKIMGKPLPLFLFAMIIHMVGDNLFNVTLSVFVKNVVEMAQKGDASGFVSVLMWCLLAGFVSLMVFFIFGTIYDIEAKRGNAKVQKLVIEKALRMPMCYYDKHHSGEIVSKLLNDADVASQIFTSRLRRVTTPIMSVIVYFVPMLLMNYRLALGLLLVNIISLLVNAKYIEPMKQVGREVSEKKKNMTKGVSTIVGGISSIKMYQRFERLLSRFQKNIKMYSDTRRKSIGMSSMLGGINTFFDMICALGFLMISIYFVNKNMASLSSVAEEDMTKSVAGEKGEVDVAVAAELKNVTFGYGEYNQLSKDGLLYNRANMKLPYGTSTAITGKSGCGKSSLFKLLLGFYELREGEIKVMGEKLTAKSRISIRNKCAYVPQNSYLFQLSVMENIRLGNLNATDEEVIMAAKAANAHEFIMNLPNGYETILENGGNNLSGGERQRIAIARAFVRKAPLLLMDEATSSLDNENDSLILDAVAGFLKNSTALIIAHKPATIAACENRLEM